MLIKGKGRIPMKMRVQGCWVNLHTHAVRKRGAKGNYKTGKYSQISNHFDILKLYLGQ